MRLNYFQPMAADLYSDEEALIKLQEIVSKAIDEESILMNKLKNPPKEVMSKGQQLSDKIASFGGSWTFIIIFLAILAGWILLNAVFLHNQSFDPYPFILMNLILSCIAALQAPIIMMSQNRQEEKDRKRAENDYLINLKSELEIRALHEKVDLLLQEEIKSLFKLQTEQIKLLEEIKEKISK